MLITVKMELSFEDLEKNCWSGAVDTLKTIREHDMEDAFMDLLFEVFCDEHPTLTAINDLLWFDDGFIFESLGIDPDDDDDYEDEDFDEEENAMSLRGDDEYIDRVAEEMMNR